VRFPDVPSVRRSLGGGGKAEATNAVNSTQPASRNDPLELADPVHRDLKTAHSLESRQFGFGGVRIGSTSRGKLRLAYVTPAEVAAGGRPQAIQPVITRAPAVNAHGTRRHRPFHPPWGFGCPGSAALAGSRSAFTSPMPREPAFRVALETPAQHAPQRRGRGRGEPVPLDIAIAREHRGQRVSHGVARAKDLAHAALTDGCGDFVDAEAGTRGERQVDGLYGRGTPPLHQCTR
jgi:hypothetical protein